MKINNETKVGLLAAISLGLLILGYNFLKDQKIFQKSFLLNARYQNVNGLGIGNPVYFNGLRVGQVRDLDIDKEKGSITVSFNVQEGLSIPVDSKAMIYDVDLLGSKGVRILSGKSRSMSSSGQFLDGVLDQSLSDQVKEQLLPLKDQLVGLLAQLERFTTWVNTTMDETNGNRIDQIMENFTGVSENFKYTSFKFDSIASSVSTVVNKTNTIVSNLKNQNENIARIVGNVGNFSDTLAASTHDIRALVKRTSEAITSVEGVLGKINSGQGTLGQLMQDTLLYNNVVSTVSRLDTFINEFTEDPRLDFYVRIGTKSNTKEADKERKARQQSRHGASSGSGATSGGQTQP